MCVSIQEPCNRRSNSLIIKRRDSPCRAARSEERGESTVRVKSVTNGVKSKKKAAMRKDCEDTVFLSLTENWVGVVACCSCGRASVHHESLMIEAIWRWRTKRKNRETDESISRRTKAICGTNRRNRPSTDKPKKKRTEGKSFVRRMTMFLSSLYHRHSP